MGVAVSVAEVDAVLGATAVELVVAEAGEGLNGGNGAAVCIAAELGEPDGAVGSDAGDAAVFKFDFEAAVVAGDKAHAFDGGHVGQGLLKGDLALFKDLDLALDVADADGADGALAGGEVGGSGGGFVGWRSGGLGVLREGDDPQRTKLTAAERRIRRLRDLGEKKPWRRRKNGATWRLITAPPSERHPREKAGAADRACRPVASETLVALQTPCILFNGRDSC